jgi:plastocyanin
MIKTIFSIGLLAGQIAAAPVVEDIAATEQFDTDPSVAAQRGRELFPIYAIANKCARICSARDRAAARGAPADSHESAKIMMSVSDANAVKGPVKALEMLALNNDLNTVVVSDSMCTRRHAMARAAGLAAGLALSAVNAPGYAAETKTVKMGSDSGQLVFVPDELKICKGDSVTWVNNKGGPHNVVFDEEGIPSGVSQESISMDDQLGDEGATFTKKFDTAGNYAYYCEPHRGAGMNAALIVE